jgi:hypothetical protein
VTGKSQDEVLWEEAEIYWQQAQEDAVRRKHIKALLIALSETANGCLKTAEDLAYQAAELRDRAAASRDMAMQALSMAEELAKAIDR